jgi:hypothetical protein
MEKDSLIKKAERDKENVEMYQKGHAIYEKFSKLYYANNLVSSVRMRMGKFPWRN